MEPKKVQVTPVTRMPAAERRELILMAATIVFGERGYAGATTDQIAKAAGISQPYVVRMFGTKEQLFIEAMDRALNKLFDAFRGVINDYDAGLLDSQLATLDVSRFGPFEGNLTGTDSGGGDHRPGHLAGLMARSYADLISDRGILLLLMQAFVSGHERTIGPRAREGFLALFKLVRDEAGMGAQHASDFLAQGMLMNTVISLRLPELFGSNALADELLQCTLKSKLDTVLAANEAHPRIS